MSVNPALTAFVTGSTGLLGSNLVRLLLERGYNVVALARSPEKARLQLGESPRLKVVRGDIEDNSTFVEALSGCDVLFHCAAYFREYYSSGDHRSRLERINVRGTIDLLNRAVAAGISRTIYISSSGVIAPRTDGQLPTEADIYPRHSQLENLYFQSKVEAEYAIAEWLQTHHHQVVSILPTWMHGPQDAAPTAAGQLVIDFLNRNLPAIPPGGSAVVDARDVALAAIAAIDRGRSGDRYIVNNRYASLVELNTILERASGIPASKIHLNYPIAIVMAWFVQTLAKLQGKTALITVNGIRTIYRGHDVDGSKSVRELGIQPRSLAETLTDSVTWRRHYG
jgi:dihydroflavonol-4-reductase